MRERAALTTADRLSPPAARPVSARPALALIEPNARLLGGHWSDNLVRLTAAARASGRVAVAVSIDGFAPWIDLQLERTGAVARTRPAARDLRAWACVGAARALRRAFAAAHPIRPRSPVPYQLLHFSRAFAEAAAVRIAARAGGGHSTTVILSASETLAGLAATLAGEPHVRIVHDVYCWEGSLLRRIESLLGHRRRDLVFICPTEGVACLLLRRYPDVRLEVRPFATGDSELYLGIDEYAAARAQLGIERGATVGAVVGGWWKEKDVETIAAALHRCSRPLTLVVAGAPLDERILAHMRGSSATVVVLRGELRPETVRAVYAASNVVVVSRRPGIVKESGLVMDCARYGVPLVVSDHDPALSERLSSEPWARLFPAGDSVALAAALDELSERPLPRPDRDAWRRLGLERARDTVEYLCSLGAGRDT